MDNGGTWTNGPKERKLKIMSPLGNTDRQKMPRKESGRGLANIEYYVDASIQGLEK